MSYVSEFVAVAQAALATACPCDSQESCEACGGSGMMAPGPVHGLVQLFVSSAAIGAMVDMYQGDRWPEIGDLLREMQVYMAHAERAPVEDVLGPEGMDTTGRLEGDGGGSDANALTPDELRTLGIDMEAS